MSSINKLKVTKRLTPEQLEAHSRNISVPDGIVVWGEGWAEIAAGEKMIRKNCVDTCPMCGRHREKDYGQR